MINIDLKKTQVPTEIDIPKKYKRPKFLIVAVAIFITILILLFVSIYILKQKTKTQTTKQKQTIHKIQTPKEKPEIKEEKKVKETENKPQQKQHETIKHKPEHPQQKRPRKEEKEKNNAENIAKLSQEAIFKINLNFENVPLKKSTNNDNFTPPLPEQLKVKKKPKKKPKQKSTIYEITIRTTRIKKLKSILHTFNIKEFKQSSKPISTIKLYDVYVGGFYNYSKILEFSKVLKRKGYKVYAIKNIKSLYFVLIDKNINEAKRIAYQKAWSRTPFKIYFKSKKKTKLQYTVKFASPSKELIKTLKKNGFYPIIKPIRNGA